MVNTSTLVAIYSVLVNCLLVILMVGTKTGIRVLKLFYIYLTHTRTKKVPVLYLDSTGDLHPKLTSVEDDGSIKIDGTKYSKNPIARYRFWGVPYMLVVDGIAEPVNLYDTAKADSMSTAELERIVYNANAQDVLGTIKTWAKIVFYGALAAGGAMAVSLYFNWKIYDVIAQGGTGELIQPNVLVPVAGDWMRRWFREE